MSNEHNHVVVILKVPDVPTENSEYKILADALNAGAEIVSATPSTNGCIVYILRESTNRYSEKENTIGTPRKFGEKKQMFTKRT